MKAFIAYVLLGWTFAPFVHFVEKYVYSDWEFLKFLFVITAADTALGFAKAFKSKQVSSRGFSQVFVKIIMYSVALIATHVLVNFSIHNQAITVFRWFDSVVFSAIIVREGISIFENIAALDPNVLPVAILKYLKQFDSITGKSKIDEKPNP